MAKKKSAWQQSEFGQIKAVNVFNAFYHTLMVAIPLLLTMIPKVDEGEMTALVVASASAFFGSLFKGMFTNSQGTPFKK